MLKYYLVVSKVFSQINLICAIIGACILFGVTSIIVVEVIFRAIYGTSMIWVIEISEYLLLFLTFLGAPYLLEKNQHVSIDLIIDIVSKSKKKFLIIFNYSLGIIICGTFTYAGTIVVLDQIETGVKAVTILAPEKYMYTIILPIGMFLLSIQFLDKIVKTIFKIEDV